jgi:hypothetical protein
MRVVLLLKFPTWIASPHIRAEEWARFGGVVIAEGGASRTISAHLVGGPPRGGEMDGRKRVSPGSSLFHLAFNASS